MPLINALPPFNIISNLAKNINKPKELIQSNIKSSKESLKIAGVSAGLVGGVISAPYWAPKVVSAAKSLAPKSAYGKLGLALGTPAIVGAGASVLKQPEKAAQIVSKGASKSFSYGADVTDFLLNPSKEKGKELVSEHPVGVSLTGLGLLGAAGYGLKNVLTGYLTYKNTKEIQKSNDLIGESLKNYKGGGYTPAPIGIPDTMPNENIPKKPKDNEKITNTLPSPASPSYIEPATNQTSWGQSSGTTKSLTKRRKPKNINRSPVNVRNNIVIANRNG